MVRFKVVKGAHLLLGFAIAVLVIVLAVLAADYYSSVKQPNASTHASLVQTQQLEGEEAKIDSIFASIGLNFGVLELDPEQNGSLDIEILPNESDETLSNPPSVLIYHTHTHEAYEQVAEDQYVAIEAWRTHDQDHSVVRVGEELSRLLRERGFSVVHDTTDNEQDELGTAYTRSLALLQSYEQTFDLYIDLHRDAYVDGTNVRLSNGESDLAQIMILIGNGVGFDVKPYYEENYAFACHLTDRINAQCADLCKNVMVKDGRYNQNIGVFSILIEVGHNLNTLQEALSSLPYLADAIESLMISDPEPELVQFRQEYLQKIDE